LALCLIDEAACHENMLEWRCSSTILDNSTWQLWSPATIPLGETISGTHWTGGWVGPRDGLNAMLALVMNWNLNSCHPLTVLTKLPLSQWNRSKCM
jgi:hypothetical protein